MLARVLSQLLFRRNVAARPGDDRFDAAGAVERSRALKRGGRMTEALRELVVAYDRVPEHPGLLRELVTSLITVDDCGTAESIAARAVETHPDSREAVLLLGMARQKLHRCEEALLCYERADRLGGADAELWDLRGSACQELGRLEEAFAAYDRALELRPDYVLAKFHRALARLLVGDFERGWPEYELRLLNDNGGASPYPRWDGATRCGVLVRREQGLGDEIMFASMFGDLQRTAGRCAIECDPRLASLFARSFPAVQVLPTRDGEASGALSGIDAEIPAGSLGAIFRRKSSDFPRHQGYLVADPARVSHWGRRLEALGPGLKVGLSWRGGVRKTRAALRSLNLDALAPILDLPGLRFVSLQYTPGAEGEIQGAAAPVVHWPEAIADYDETAALVCALDIVVSVCTSVVHLCGALGRPAWVLAPLSPEWRYGFTGSGMPWYPSVRIFRQRSYGDWRSVVGEVADALRSRLAAGSS